MKATANDNALMEKQQAEKSIPPKAKREIEEIIEQLRRTKKKPGDWTFIPRRKHIEGTTVLLKDGESKLVDAGGGAFRSQQVRAPLTVRVNQVKTVLADGTLIGGYHPRQEMDWTPEQILEEMIKLSLNPSCEIVPYEAREMGKEAKDVQADLLAERRRRQAAEDKLRALEEKGVTPEALEALQKQVDELTKPPKK